MQLFALNNEQIFISAANARKHCDYFCMECGKKVRKRGGSYRQNHFYHIKPDPACRQSQKSLVHLQLQWFISQELPLGEARLERRFPEISRIADVAWEKEKLIFEVQYSSISQVEVEARNRDYESLGYQVVWILHDRRFNKWKATAAELWLDQKPHYFSNFDPNGNGVIYDQLQVFHEGIRRFQQKGKEITISRPSFQKGKCVFEGDFDDRRNCGDQEALRLWSDYEKERKKWRKTPYQVTWQAVKRWYLNIFNLLLEKCCQ